MSTGWSDPNNIYLALECEFTRAPHQKRVFYPQKCNFYRGTPSRHGWASFGLDLSSYWAGFAVKTWQPSVPRRMRVLSSERKQGAAHAHSTSAAPRAYVVYVQESMRMRCGTLQIHGLFCRSSWWPFWTLNVVGPLLSTKGQKVLRFHQKYLNLCSEKKTCLIGLQWHEGE